MCLNLPEISNRKIYLSSYWVYSKCKDVTADNMNAALKFVATTLYYPSLKSIPVEIVDTHFLRAGGANSFSLAVYINRYIQKIG